MTKTRKTLLLILILTALAVPLSAQGTYTAASCNWSDVNAVINGPTHTAIAGDTILIPAGTCVWSSGLSVGVNITIIGSGNQNGGAESFGAGTLNTIIVDNYASGSNSIFTAQIAYASGALFRLSTLDIEPNSSSTALSSPVSIAGTCTSSGCPAVRLDNLEFGKNTQWTEAGNSSNAQTMIRADGVFGVIDHCTVPSGSQVAFANISHSSYLGVGAYGDNSWAQPDSFGTANNLFLENNILYTSMNAVDAEFAPTGGGVGGGRYVARFNQIDSNTGFYEAFSFHGLDTDGRPQGGRTIEAYGNTLNCVGGSCGAGVAGFRSGTGKVFGNTLNAVSGSWYNNIVDITVYRIVFNASNGWGACGGSGPLDTNDGVTYYSGTMTTSASGVLTMTDSSKSWTTNQFIPNGAPYSVYDTTQGFWSEITGNTSDTITIAAPISESGWTGFNNGDSYQILRATVCADQGGRGAGNYVSGTTPSPASPIMQALDPIYEWDDTANNLNHGNFATNTGRTIANRDWYTDGSNGSPQAQTSPSSPFNGTSGVGFGTLANRPATCTPYVGYFATGQGNWNTSGNGFGNGVLYQCSAPNTWTVHYTPYTYPHPLTQGSPAPPTNLVTVVQ
jgi:hypothetical protein